MPVLYIVLAAVLYCIGILYCSTVCHRRPMKLTYYRYYRTIAATASNSKRYASRTMAALDQGALGQMTLLKC